jgi:hypothetical protein
MRKTKGMKKIGEVLTPKMPLRRPSREMITSRAEIIMPPTLIPSQEPFDRACRALCGFSSSSLGMVILPAVSGSSSSLEQRVS